jgi:hypothetical protein
MNFHHGDMEDTKKRDLYHREGSGAFRLGFFDEFAHFLYQRSER